MADLTSSMILFGTNEVNKRSLRVERLDKYLNWRGDIKFNKIQELFLSMENDTIYEIDRRTPSFYKFYLYLCYVYVKINKFILEETGISELDLHNKLQHGSSPIKDEGMIIRNFFILNYAIKRVYCFNDDNVSSNEKCREVILYLLKLSYNSIEFLTRYQNVIFDVYISLYKKWYDEDVKKSFDAFNVKQVKENQWSSLINQDLHEELIAIKDTHIRFFADIQIFQEDNVKILTNLNVQLNKLLEKVGTHHVFDLKILAAIRAANINFGNECIPNEVIEYIKNPVKEAKKPPRSEILSGGKYKRRLN